MPHRYRITLAQAARVYTDILIEAEDDAAAVALGAEAVRSGDLEPDWDGSYVGRWPDMFLGFVEDPRLALIVDRLGEAPGEITEIYEGHPSLVGSAGENGSAPGEPPSALCAQAAESPSPAPSPQPASVGAVRDLNRKGRRHPSPGVQHRAQATGAGSCGTLGPEGERRREVCDGMKGEERGSRPVRHRRPTMATSSPKVVLNASRDIPFNKLVPSAANVRRIKAGISLDDLAEDIARRGLVASLSVRPVLDGEGQETGLFEVTGGGRRLGALQLLVKAKRLAKTTPVPCVVQVVHGTAAEEDSLAENTMRAGLHPLDQFRAFRTLREERGLSDEEIAAAFFVSAQVVKQRLKLTAVSETLLDLYADDQLSLEQLMAFAVADDHARQEQVWEAIQRGYNKEPFLIRRMLTEGKVSAAERRAVFVGPDAYQAAGGTIARDLFQQDAGGWFEDVALLDRLVDEKLKEAAGAVMAEGWKWIEVARDFPYGHTHGLRRVFSTPVPLSDEEQARLDASREAIERIEAEHAETGEDLPEEVDRRLAELEAEIAGLEERPGFYDPDEVARAGAYVSLGHEGRVRVERGYVRPEDEAVADDQLASSMSDAAAADNSDGSAPRTVNVAGGMPSAMSTGTGVDADEDADPGKPLSERLVTELTAHRTLSLREALANDPDVALVAVLHALALRAFYGQQSYDPASCLEIEAKSAVLSGGATQGGSSLGETSAAQALARMHESWGAQLPKKPQDLWDWLLDLDTDSRTSLFAYCAARTVNAVHQTWDRRPLALAHGNRLAEALRLDMAAQWSPGVANYLGRVTKPQILAAVREAKGEAAAQSIDHLKKGDMASGAERLLAGTGWLPAILRTPGLNVETDASGAGETDSSGSDSDTALNDDGSSGEDLPAFLTDDVDAGAEGEGADPNEAYSIAAE